MDIARYISLYLIKYGSCYIDGLGTLAIEKHPSYYDGQTLQARGHDVSLSSTASSDELANFISSNEHAGLSNVFVELHNFTNLCKAKLAAGEDIIIPAIGKFTKSKDTIDFIVHDAFLYRPPAIASKHHDDDAIDVVTEKGKKSGLLTIVYVIILLGVLAGGGWYAYEMYLEQTAYFILSEPEPSTNSNQKNSSNQVVSSKGPADSIKRDTARPISIIQNADTATLPKHKVYKYDVVLKSYYTLAAAEKSLETLKAQGNDVQLETNDSVKYSIVMRVRTYQQDTNQILDSLGKLFNTGGVYIH